MEHKIMSRKEFLVALGLFAGTATLSGLLGKASLARSFVSKDSKGKLAGAYGNASYGGQG